MQINRIEKHDFTESTLVLIFIYIYYCDCDVHSGANRMLCQDIKMIRGVVPKCERVNEQQQFECVNTERTEIRWWVEGDIARIRRSNGG